MKYVVTVGGEDYTIAVEEESGEIKIDGESRVARLQSVDRELIFSLILGAASYEVFAERSGDNHYYITIEGERYEVAVEEERARWKTRRSQAVPTEPGEATVTTPMPGVIVAVSVEEGQTVTAGDRLAIVEAMKMENEIRAPCSGIVESVHVTPGQTVNLNDVIASIGIPEKERSQG